MSGLTTPNCTADEVTRQPGEHAGQDEAGELVAEGGEAERTHAMLVDADAGDHPSEQRAQHDSQEKEHRDEQASTTK